MGKLTQLCFFLGLLLTPGVVLLAQAAPDALSATSIDTQKSDALVKQLDQADESEWIDLYKEFLSSADQYQPFAIYAVAYSLLQRGKKGEAAFWYSVAKLRASYDALRCADLSAGRAIIFLEDRYPELGINLKCKYDRLHDGLSMALRWDEKHQYNYDPRWVNLFAQGASAKGNITRPESTWPQFHQNARNEVARGLRTIESQGTERWNSTQRLSAQKGLNDYEATLKRAKETHDSQLEKKLEQMQRTKSALEACLKE
jgi:hypothetical protein